MKQRFLRGHSKIILLVLMLICSSITAQDFAPFHSKFQTTQEQPLNVTFTHSDTIPLTGLGAIYALSIDATIYQPKEGSFSRIILEDTNGHNYLVAESDWFRNDTTIVDLTEYCEETALLDGIVPLRLKCYLAKEASIEIYGIHVTDQIPSRGLNHIYGNKDAIKRNQIESIVDRINAYNRKHHKLWKAGMTGLSFKSHEEKMRILGCSLDGNTYRLEYYYSGIIDIGESPQELAGKKTSSLYVDDFDWRERHGKNWLTPVKDQGESGYCSAFSAISCTEALVNLYLNNQVSLDLSEQEAASCNSYTLNTSINFYIHGMPIDAPLKYIRDVGVCDEMSYPFVDDSMARFCHSNEVTPQDLVTISGISSDLKYPSQYNEDRIKEALIKYGPLSSGIYATNGPNHAMALIGYGKVKEGDIVQRIWNYSGTKTGLTDSLHVAPNSPFIGRNYWIFKNSYTNGGSLCPPYMLVMMDLPSSINNTYALYNPQWRHIAADGSYELVDDVICEDSDGDGFYFWGLGPKPPSCPSWVPDEADGDDSDYTKGPMDEYGWLRDLNPDNNDTLYIDADSIWDSHRYLHHHVCIRNNATLTIRDSVKCYQDVSITIQSNGTLMVDGGTLEDAYIKLLPGGNVKIQENGHIIPCAGRDFSVPLGAEMQIDYGQIE